MLESCLVWQNKALQLEAEQSLMTGPDKEGIDEQSRRVGQERGNNTDRSVGSKTTKTVISEKYAKFKQCGLKALQV